MKKRQIETIANARKRKSNPPEKPQIIPNGRRKRKREEEEEEENDDDDDEEEEEEEENEEKEVEGQYGGGYQNWCVCILLLFALLFWSVSLLL